MPLKRFGARVGGYHQSPRNSLHVDNAVYPAGRNTVAFLISGAVIRDGADADEVRAAGHLVTDEIMGPWREVAPNSIGAGVYQNEADVTEPDRQQAFHGSNYPRLLEIKTQWDPEGVLYAITAVGSEFWEVRDGDLGTRTRNGRLNRIA